MTSWFWYGLLENHPLHRKFNDVFEEMWAMAKRALTISQRHNLHPSYWGYVLEHGWLSSNSNTKKLTLLCVDCIPRASDTTCGTLYLRVPSCVHDWPWNFLKKSFKTMLTLLRFLPTKRGYFSGEKWSHNKD